MSAGQERPQERVPTSRAAGGDADDEGGDKHDEADNHDVAANENARVAGDAEQEHAQAVGCKCAQLLCECNARHVEERVALKVLEEAEDPAHKVVLLELQGRQ